MVTKLLREIQAARVQQYRDNWQSTTRLGKDSLNIIGRPVVDAGKVGKVTSGETLGVTLWFPIL